MSKLKKTVPELPASSLRGYNYGKDLETMTAGMVGEIEQEVARARSRRELTEEIADALRSAGGPETARS